VKTGKKFLLDGGHSVFGSEETADLDVLEGTLGIMKHKYIRISSIPSQSQFEAYFDLR